MKSIVLLENYAGLAKGDLAVCESHEDAATLVADGIGKYCTVADRDEATTREATKIAKMVRKQLNAEAGSSNLPVFGGAAQNTKIGLAEEVSLKSFWMGSTNKADDVGFSGLGDYLSAVQLAKKGGFDPRLKTLMAGDNSAGGFLVPDSLLATIYDEANQLTSVLAKCRRFTTSSSGLKIPAFFDYDWSSGLYGMETTDTAEDVTLSEAEPSFEQIGMSLHKRGFILPVTNELIEDSPQVLSSVLPNVMAQAVNFGIDKSIIKGSGAGEPLGVLNAPSLIAIEKLGGQPADTLQYGNILEMYSRLLPGAASGAVWLVHSACVPELAKMTVAVGTGGSVVWLQDASAAVPGKILGIPILVHPHCNPLGDEGDIILANFGAYGVLGKAGTDLVRIDFSEHQYFTKYKSCWRVVCRIDGQPLQSDVVTHPDGVTTMSNFITLKERA